MSGDQIFLVVWMGIFSLTPLVAFYIFWHIHKRLPSKEVLRAMVGTTYKKPLGSRYEWVWVYDSTAPEKNDAVGKLVTCNYGVNTFCHQTLKITGYNDKKLFEVELPNGVKGLMEACMVRYLSAVPATPSSKSQIETRCATAGEQNDGDGQLEDAA